MRPVARIWRQHQTRNLAQLADAAGECLAEEAELGHAKQKQQQRSGAQRQHEPALAARRPEMMRMTTADRDKLDRRARDHPCRSSRPIRRWRTWPVAMSITDTVMTIS